MKTYTISNVSQPESAIISLLTEKKSRKRAQKDAKRNWKFFQKKIVFTCIKMQAKLYLKEKIIESLITRY